jgi:hypothetical protein
MSDVSQGGGWWIASDGKWYPPELHPDALALAAVTSPSDGLSPSALASTGGTGLRLEQREPVGVQLDAEPVTAPVVVDKTHRNISVSVPPSRRRRGRGLPSPKRRTVVLALAVLVIAAGVGVAYVLTRGSASSIDNDSPGQVLSLATAAAGKAGSVHAVTDLRGSGGSATYVQDAGTNEGRLLITAAGGVRVSAVVVRGVAYVQASSAGWQLLLSASPNLAQQLAGKWLSIPSSNQLFGQIAQTITLSGLIREISPAKSISELPTTSLAGRAVIDIQGELPGGVLGSLYVPTTGNPLPVQELSRNKGGTTSTTFTDWGERFTVSPPLGAVPADSIPGLEAGGVSSSSDRAAQSNLTNAMTEILASFQSTQTYCEQSCAAGLTPLTLSSIQASAPEFTWTNGEASAAADVSIQPVDESPPGGSGAGVILAVLNPATDTCWYGAILSSPTAPAFSDTGPNLDFAPAQTATSPGQWLAPVGGTGSTIAPGTLYAKATVGGSSPGSPTPTQGCAAGFPVGRSVGAPRTWKWGTSFSNAPVL